MSVPPEVNSATLTQIRSALKHKNIAIVIVLVAFYFRFKNVFDQSPVSIDSNYYVIWAKDLLTGSGFPGIMKPLWVIMVAMGYVAMGYRLWVASLLSAFCGTLIVAVMYRLGRRYFGRSAGLYAGMLSASLLTYIHLSRWSQGHMTSMLLCLSAALLYEEALRRPRRMTMYLLLSGIMVGASLYVHAVFMSMVLLLILWAIWDSIADRGGHRVFKERLAQPLTLAAGITLSMIVPETIIRIARLRGEAAPSWLGGLYETIFHFQSTADAGNTYDFGALFSYWNIFSTYEGKIISSALVIGTGMLAWQVRRSRSVSLLRGLSIFVFTFGFVELSTVFKGVQMAKFMTGMLPGVPLVLGYFLARLEHIISSLTPSMWRAVNPATICAALCAVVAMWGHWHAKSRIEWNTGHNDAYILVQQLDPERIFYSGSIWDFHFSGKANAFSIESDGIDVLSGASGRDILVATRLGACEAKSLATDKPAGFQLNQMHLIASVPSFDYTIGHDISPTLEALNLDGLGGRLCHVIYSF